MAVRRRYFRVEKSNFRKSCEWSDLGSLARWPGTGKTSGRPMMVVALSAPKGAVGPASRTEKPLQLDLLLPRCPPLSNVHYGFTALIHLLSVLTTFHLRTRILPSKLPLRAAFNDQRGHESIKIRLLRLLL